MGVEFRPSKVAIQDPALARLYAYWNAKRGAREFPSRADIDPLDLGYVLGCLMLVDVAYDPIRFRLRLYGTNLADRMGFDLTGRGLGEHPCAEFRTKVAQKWRETVETRQPTHAKVDAWMDDRRLSYESLRLPLSSDGALIDMLLVAVVHLDVQGSPTAGAA